VGEKAFKNVLLDRYIAPAISAFPPSMAVKQWRKPRRRIRELIKLGVRKKEAISLGLSRKSYWRLSKTLATNAGLDNAHFKQIGLISMRTLWCKIHHPATAR
jgi:hypothetical protein